MGQYKSFIQIIIIIIKEKENKKVIKVKWQGRRTDGRENKLERVFF